MESHFVRLVVFTALGLMLPAAAGLAPVAAEPAPAAGSLPAGPSEPAPFTAGAPGGDRERDREARAVDPRVLGLCEVFDGTARLLFQTHFTGPDWTRGRQVGQAYPFGAGNSLLLSSQPFGASAFGPGLFGQHPTPVFTQVYFPGSHAGFTARYLQARLQGPRVASVPAGAWAVRARVRTGTSIPTGGGRKGASRPSYRTNLKFR